MLLISIVLILFLWIVLLLVDLRENTSHLLFEQLLQFFLSLLIQIVLLAEIKCQLNSCVAFVHYNTLLLIASEVNINEEKWLLLGLMTIMVLLVLLLLFAWLRSLRHNFFLFFLLLMIELLILNVWNLLSLFFLFIILVAIPIFVQLRQCIVLERLFFLCVINWVPYNSITTDGILLSGSFQVNLVVKHVAMGTILVESIIFLQGYVGALMFWQITLPLSLSCWLIIGIGHLTDSLFLRWLTIAWSWGFGPSLWVLLLDSCVGSQLLVQCKLESFWLILAFYLILVIFIVVFIKLVLFKLFCVNCQWHWSNILLNLIVCRIMWLF